MPDPPPAPDPPARLAPYRPRLAPYRPRSAPYHPRSAPYPPRFLRKQRRLHRLDLAARRRRRHGHGHERRIPIHRLRHRRIEPRHGVRLGIHAIAHARRIRPMTPKHVLVELQPRDLALNL